MGLTAFRVRSDRGVWWNKHSTEGLIQEMDKNSALGGGLRLLVEGFLSDH